MDMKKFVEANLVVVDVKATESGKGCWDLEQFVDDCPIIGNSCIMDWIPGGNKKKSEEKENTPENLES